MPGARDLQHDGSQPVTDEVVHVASDPTAFGEQRLVVELAPGALELAHEPFLPSDRTDRRAR